MMNRRTFFSQVAAVAAVPVVVPIAAKLQAAALPPLSAEDLAASVPAKALTLTLPPPAFADGTMIKVITPEGKELQVAVSRPPDLLTLLLARGLMRPCPNCHAVLWTRPHNRCCMECSGCGWLDTLEHFALPCECLDCAPYLRMSAEELRTATLGTVLQPANLAYLEHDAPAGRVYRVVDDYGQPVTRFARNSYDVNTDGYLHNVTERRLARVACAVRVAKDHRGTYAPGCERTVQPNGNLVIHAWEIADSYEAQQDRGEHPPAIAHTDGRGFVSVERYPIAPLGWVPAHHPLHGRPGYVGAEPTVEQYGSYEAYLLALQEWNLQQGLARVNDQIAGRLRP
jgi:hypothetical protein